MEPAVTATPSVVYHRVPRELRGSILYPLNQLQHVFPDLAAQQFKKYHNRAHLLSVPIPPLLCLWNDVLMFSPVHPGEIHAALVRAGHHSSPGRWFEVPITPFTNENTVLYLPKAYKTTPPFLAYSPETLLQHTVFPPFQEVLYRQVAPGNPVLLFNGIIHVMYKGVIDLHDVRIITVP
jgi:hypothetical protein